MQKAQQSPTLLGFLVAKGWVWKVAIAGLCGSITHTLLMFAKAQLGILESFQPYHSLQVALSYWTGGARSSGRAVADFVSQRLDRGGICLCPPLRASAGQQRSDQGG